MIDLNQPETKFALQAVQRACQLVQQVQDELVDAALTKSDASPVTVADFASQALVSFMLAQAFPKDVLVAEEDSRTLTQDDYSLEQVTRFVSTFIGGTNREQVRAWIDRGAGEPGDRFWTLDPIDGTKGFLRGDQYAVALALVVGGRVQIGVLGCPNLGNLRAGESNPVNGNWGERDQAGGLFMAVRDQGAWSSPLAGELKFERLQVSNRDDPVQARILRSFESGHTNVSQVDLFAQALDVQASAIRMDSQAKYAVLAAGSGELYLRLISPQKPDYREKIWDQAAGSLLVEEAGGRVTDLDGKPLNFSMGRNLVKNRGVLASNGPLHQAALKALRRIAA
jgi:3'(2'), 5'-bisphosphate nucleotidase